MSRLTCGHIQLMYSWWWVRLSPETCRVKPLRRIKTQLLHLVELISLLHSSISLSPQIILQQWPKLYRKIPQKAFCKLSKHWDVINFRPTADTLHVNVTVARIGKPSKHLDFLHFYTLHFMYNSQLLVFYSTQSPVTACGYATNRNSTSWEEFFPQQCKLSVNYWKRYHDVTRTM